MKKLITICAAALALSAFAADTDCGALITTGNIADSAKVENLTGANAGKATITINDNSGTAKSVTVYNASTTDTALAGKASTGSVEALETRATALESSTNNLTTAVGGKVSKSGDTMTGDLIIGEGNCIDIRADNGIGGYYNAKYHESHIDLRGVPGGGLLRFPLRGDGEFALYGDITNTVPAWALNSTKPSYNFSEINSKPTTLAGYGITDAKIANGTITLGSNSITPLTSYTETDPVWTAAKGLYSTTAQMNSAITAATNGLAKASALTGYVPTSRKVAGMSLTGDITLKSLSIVGASTTTYNGSAAASVNQSTLTEAAKTAGGTSGKTLTLAVASTSRSLGEYYIAIGAEGKPHLMLRQ